MSKFSNYLEPITNSPGKSSLCGTKMENSKLGKMSKGIAIRSSNMARADMIRTIQREEGAIECFGTEWIEYCGKHRCLWKDECLAENSKIANPIIEN